MTGHLIAILILPFPGILYIFIKNQATGTLSVMRNLQLIFKFFKKNEYNIFFLMG